MSRHVVNKSAILLCLLLASPWAWAESYYTPRVSKKKVTPSISSTPAPSSQKKKASFSELKDVTIVSQPDEDLKSEKKKSRADWDLPIRLDPDVSIAKVYEFLNDPAKTKVGHNTAFEYEFKYFNYGAVTEAQKKSKRGHYYIVSWKNGGPIADMILRFDYRQAKTQDLVHTLEIPFKNAEGFYKANFSVIGDAYAHRGIIRSWRISVVRNGVIIAKEQSYIW